MFFHIFAYRLKCIVRDRGLIFWTLVFPILLATLFGMAFSNLSSADNFQKADIAVVNNEAYQKNEDFRNNFLEQINKGENSLLNIELVDTREKADNLLEDGKIIGYIELTPDIKFIVKKSGISQSIVKVALDEYLQTVNTITDIVVTNPTAVQNILKDINDRKEYTKEVVLGTKNKPDPTVNYFYSLLAMACLYGAFFGLKEISDVQANLSKRAQRVNVSPVHKLKILIAGLFASYLVFLVEILILISYMVFIIKVDFGNQIGYILLTCIVGCSTGLSLGAFISALIKKREGVKTAILLGITMTGSFLAGMMGNPQNSMKYIIANKVPVLSYINPVAVITDALYALYYYDTYSKYFINISILCSFTILFCFWSYVIIRRQKYANI